MDNTPKISIIVPVYNREKSLCQCVDSIVAQTLHEIEIILVDDGSRDNSSAICDKYAAADSRVRVIHKKNEGMGVAYNTGIAKARGEYIGFVETDDWIEPEMYEALYSVALEQDVDVVQSLYTEIRAGQEPIVCNKFNPEVLNRKVTDSFSVVEYTRHILAHWSAIYRRSFILDKQILFPPTPGASHQDVAFNWQVFVKMGSCYIMPKSFYNYDMSSPQSSINQGYKTALFALGMQRWIFEWSVRHKLSDNFLELLKETMFRLLYWGYIKYEGRLKGIRKIQFILKVSELFRACLPGLQFLGYTPYEKQEYLSIAKHPIFYILESVIYEKIASKERKSIKFAGVELYARNRKPGKIYYRILRILYRKDIETSTLRKSYFMGLFPYASAEVREHEIVKRFLGVRYKTKTISR